MSAPRSRTRVQRTGAQVEILGRAVSLLEYLLCSNKVLICSTAEMHLGSVLDGVRDAFERATKMHTSETREALRKKNAGGTQ